MVFWQLFLVSMKLQNICTCVIMWTMHKILCNFAMFFKVCDYVDYA